MALTGFAAPTSYLRRIATPPLTTEPMYISWWGYHTQTPGLYYCAFHLGLTSATHTRNAHLNDGNLVGIQSRDASVQANISSSTAITTSQWFHGAAAFISSASRRVWRNAGSANNDTTAVGTITTPDRMHIGNDANASFPWHSTGYLAEISLWNATGMSQANLDSLSSKLFNGGVGGAGGNPLNITAESSQPWTGMLRAYWPLTSTTDLADASGNGHLMTMVGTLTNAASHPTIETVTPAGDPPGSIRPRSAVFKEV